MLPHLGLRPTPHSTGPLRPISHIAILLLLSALPLIAACGEVDLRPSPSEDAPTASVISSEYGRVWGRLPVDFPLLAEGSAEVRLDVLASGAIFSRLSVDEALRSAVDELRRLAWEVAEPAQRAARYLISATRDQGACTVTIIVEALGSRTSLVVYLGEGCPAP